MKKLTLHHNLTFKEDRIMKMSSIIRVSLVILALLVSTAMVNIRAAEAKEWTFMVYIAADNNLEGAAIDDFLEMSSVGSDSDINIVVQVDRTAGHNNEYGDWTTTHRFLITPGMEPRAVNAISNWGDGKGGREINMGDPQNLIDFVDWSINNYPAYNYALILWNHGGGWRKKTTGKELPEKEVCNDGNDALLMNELQNALSTIYQSTRDEFALLGFDACLMGMVEVAYEMQDYAMVMVGSEEKEPNDGWPYDTILSDLADNPLMQSMELGTVIVNRYGESMEDGSKYTQSAIDLTKISSASAFFSTVISRS
jgi:clostripain